MLNQIQDYPITPMGVFTKSDRDIINYLKRQEQVASSSLFRYFTGSPIFDSELEAELREMLYRYGFRLYKRRAFNTSQMIYNDAQICVNKSIWYYSISQHRRRGCYPCGIRKNNPWMTRCLHWKNCHYGMSGKCQLAKTMN